MAQHPVQEIPYRQQLSRAEEAGSVLHVHEFYTMVVEIPAGTLEKWQTHADTGGFYHDAIDNVPRIINFLPYPMNYGFIPQTLLSRENGGDGDPMDIVLLSSAEARETVLPVRIIGALHLSERGERDTKIVALKLENGPFSDIHELSELLFQFPGAVEILTQWFLGYKGPGRFLFEGYATSKESAQLIEQAHEDWKQHSLKK